MDLSTLQERLRDPDQWVRVEALRILAMVEETRALRDIEWVYKNDPEPGVRQVAQWAGRIVYAAFKQQQQQRPPESAEDARREERLLSSLVDTSPATYHAMQAQLLQRQLAETLTSESEAPRPALRETTPATPILPKKEFRIAARSTDENLKQVTVQANERLDLLDLLDAGLSEEFFS